MIIKKIAFVVLMLSIQPNRAQTKFIFGSIYSAGASTILKTKSANDMNAAPGVNNKMSMKLMAGAGIIGEYFITEKWGVFLQTGFQQRGTVFKEYMDEYKPRYRLNYWDVVAGCSYRRNALNKQAHFSVNVGITQHSLLEANRVYDSGSDNITDEFKRIDLGFFLGIGGNFPVNDKDLVRVQLFSNAGMLQVFSENLISNGMRGKNFIAGIQLTYLAGKSKEKNN